MRLTFKPYIILLMFAIIPLQSGAWDIKGQWIRKLVLVEYHRNLTVKWTLPWKAGSPFNRNCGLWLFVWRC